ncbi:amino acid ABC transporter substrate-binding protein [Marinobacter profundi]|uniref:Amino acid ABC transporter substrate-binding protein n=2 Tax=Marinobacter profundi TaxID=2666256 RepID=A0A2G1UL55_9GAMM|nr:amino acid ABC transporter substrate-binding protein [Marinobacter profundi]
MGVMTLRLWSPFLLLFALMAAPVAADHTGRVLRIGYVEFPPIEYQDENGQPAGEFIELTRVVAAEAGYDVQFVFLPISRAYLYLANGQIDLWPGLTAIPELHDHVVESWVSPIAIQLSAWYLESTPPVTRFESFHDSLLILIAGYTYGGLSAHLMQSDALRITEAPNHQAALDMLRKHRGHYLLDYREPVRTILTQDGTRPRILETPVRSRNGAWLFSLARHHAVLLRDEFDEAYLRLAAAGKVPAPRAESSGYVLPGFPDHLR